VIKQALSSTRGERWKRRISNIEAKKPSDLTRLSNAERTDTRKEIARVSKSQIVSIVDDDARTRLSRKAIWRGDHDRVAASEPSGAVTLKSARSKSSGGPPPVDFGKESHRLRRLALNY